MVLKDDRHFAVVVQIDGTSSEYDFPHGLWVFIRPVEVYLIRRDAQSPGYLILHVRNHLGIASQLFHQVAESGRVVGLVGVGYLCVGVVFTESRQQFIKVFCELLRVKQVVGSSLFLFNIPE